MKDYGVQRSAIEPLEVEITETKVFAASDVKQITVNTEEQKHVEYEFNLVEYDKDEYIKMIDEKNAYLESQATDLQLALCDVYEMIGG